MARWVLLALCLAAAAGPARAAAPPAPAHQAGPAPLPPDRTTALPPRRPDAARLRELAAQREFRYVEPETDNEVADSLWARFWHWLERFRGTRTGHSSGQYFEYIFILGTLVFAVLKLMQVDVTGAFGRSARRGQLAYAIEAEDIHEVDFRTRIAEAEAAGNFRLATRLGYLEVLKHLTDHDLIHWQPDKTNHGYLAELPAGPLRDAFRATTREFEYVWYGELRLTAALYQQARASQRAVSRLLTGSRAATPNPLSA